MPPSGSAQLTLFKLANLHLRRGARHHRGSSQQQEHEARHCEGAKAKRALATVSVAVVLPSFFANGGHCALSQWLVDFREPLFEGPNCQKRHVTTGCLTLRLDASTRDRDTTINCNAVSPPCVCQRC